MDSSKTSSQRTPSPSYTSFPLSPGAKSMFPNSNAKIREEKRINDGAPKPTKRKFTKRKFSNTYNNTNKIPPNHFLSSKEQEKRTECNVILKEIKELHAHNYNCCEAICNDSKIINNTAIINKYLKKIKKYNEKLCYIDVEQRRLGYTLGNPPKLNLNKNPNRPFKKSKRRTTSNKKTNPKLMPGPNIPVGHPKHKSSAPAPTPAPAPVPAHSHSSQSSQSSQSSTQGSSGIESTQDYQGNNSQTPPK